MTSSRKKKRSIPGRFSNPPKRISVDAEYIVALNPEEREYLSEWVRSYLEQIPQSERELLISKISRDTLREILQRVSPGAQDPKFLPTATKVRLIFGALSKLDSYFVSGLLEPMHDDLRVHFGVAEVDRPTEADFTEFITHLRQTWSRATVNALVAHTALSPVPAQGFAVEEMLHIQQARENGTEAPLMDIEFPLEKVEPFEADSTDENQGLDAALATQTGVEDLESNEGKPDVSSHLEEIVSDHNFIEVPESAADHSLSAVSAVSSDLGEANSQLEGSAETELVVSQPKESLDAVHEPIEVPDIHDQIYTSLGRMLISQAIASADGRQIGALSQEDFALMLEEFVSLNIDHRPTWFQAGFASALGLVEQDFLLDSRAVNASRMQHYLWGYIKGLVRSGRTAQIREVCLREWPLIISMFADNIGQDLVLDVSREMIYANLDFAEDLLKLTPRIAVLKIEHEIQLLHMIDTESVHMLRMAEPWRAAKILKIAEHRLSHLMNHPDLRPNYLRNLMQLHVGIRMGLAASYRISGDFSTAKTALTDVPADHIQVSSPKTRARYYIQRALSESETKRIEDVLLPRTHQDRKVFQKKFLPVVALIELAQDERSDNPDTYYLMAGLAMAAEDYTKASSLLGQARLGYENRDDRQLLLPQLKLQQAIVSFRLDNYGEMYDSINLLTENEFNWKLRSEEASSMVAAMLGNLTGELPRVTEWLCRQPEGAALLNKAELEAVFDSSPTSLHHVARLSRRLSSQVDRLNILLLLLDDALTRAHSEDIEAALDHIDDLRTKHSPEVHRMWANYCRTNQSFRKYLGLFESDLSAIASLGELPDSTELEQVLISVLDDMLHIHIKNFEEEANFNQLLQQLDSLSPEYATFYEGDPRAKAPTTHTKWKKSQAAEDAKSSTPVTVLFVGGNPERQNEINRDTKLDVERKFNGEVNVEFHIPGWGSSWMDTIHKIERQLPKTDAVVVMPLTRTTFGRTLRRKLNDVHVPRISCTAEGKASTMRAIEEAVKVAQRLRGE